MRIPEVLKSTYMMLYQVFPNGISEEDYWIVLYLLYDYMADENLAVVMSFFIDKPLAIIENDIYRVCQMQLDSELLDKIKSKLEQCGFEEWKKVD